MRNLLVTVGTVLSLSLGGAAMAKVNEADQAFLTQDVQGGRYELALAKLGVAKAKAPAVRRYSQELVRDHQSANATLMTLARQEGVSAPVGMTAQDQQKLTQMQRLSGAAFDKAFVGEMVQINAEDEQVAKKEKATTSDARIKAYIKRFEAMDAEHKRGALQLKGTV